MRRVAWYSTKRCRKNFILPCGTFNTSTDVLAWAMLCYYFVSPVVTFFFVACVQEHSSRGGEGE